MINIPLVIALIVVIGAWHYSGILWDKFMVKDEEKEVEPRSFPVHIQTPSATYYQVISPYNDNHFVELNGKMRPRYLTVYQHSEYIDFQLEDISPNDFVTHWIVKGSFTSRLEHCYDVKWEEGVIDFTWKTKIPFGDFPTEKLEDEQFKYLLECYCLCEIWNHYYKLYPHLMQHPAVVGTNPTEHEHLR